MKNTLKSLTIILLTSMAMVACDDSKSISTTKPSTSKAQQTSSKISAPTKLSPTQQLSKLTDERFELASKDTKKIDRNIDAMIPVLETILNDLYSMTADSKNYTAEELETISSNLLALWQIPAGEEATVGTMKEMAFASAIQANIHLIHSHEIMADYLQEPEFSSHTFPMFSVIGNPADNVSEETQTKVRNAFEVWCTAAFAQTDETKKAEIASVLLKELTELNAMYRRSDLNEVPATDPNVRLIARALIGNYNAYTYRPHQTRVLELTKEILMIEDEETTFKVAQEIVPLVSSFGADGAFLTSDLTNLRNFFAQKRMAIESETQAIATVATTSMNSQVLELNQHIETIDMVLKAIEFQK